MGYRNYPTWGNPKFSSKINEVFINQIKKSSAASIISSSCNEEPMEVDQTHRGRYVVVFCPADGPVNRNEADCVTTTFGIYDTLDIDGQPKKQVLQSGKKLLVAGYAIYGSNTSLQIGIKGTLGGAHNFILTNDGEFSNTQSDYLMPPESCFYSVNESKSITFSKSTNKFIVRLKNPPQGPEFAWTRQSSSIIADIHQVYINGGVYFLPSASSKQILKIPNYRAPLMVHQIIPVAFILKKAGGLAINDENQALLGVPPKEYFETGNFILGSYKNMTEYINSLSRRNPFKNPKESKLTLGIYFNMDDDDSDNVPFY